MEKSGKVALGRVVIGTRERLVAIEPRGVGMLVTTLRAHDEIRDSAALFGSIPNREPDARMIAIAEQIIEQQVGPFDPSEFNDRYEDALRALIRDKQEGGDGGVTAAPPRDDNVIDLMEALRRSLEKTGGAGTSAKSPTKPAAKAAARPTAKATAKSRVPARKRASGP
jgi:DNA end-binding protein Ku